MVENITQAELASMIAGIKDKVGDIDADALQGIMRQGLYGSLSAAQKKRIRATRYLEKQCEEIDQELAQKIFELTQELKPRYDRLHEIRKTIITGEKEPTEEEAPEDEILNYGVDYDDDDDDESPRVEEVNEDEENDEEKPSGEEKGIPNFWLQVMDHAGIEFEEADAALLSALVDIRFEHLDMYTFRLEFEFVENDYINNKTLSLEFNQRDDDEEDHGTLSGCEIDWKEDMRLTTKKVTKKQRSTKTNKTRTVTKEVPVKSFFGIFELNLKKDDFELWEEIEKNMYDVSGVVMKLRHEVIPAATSYFLDLVSDSEDDDDEYDEDDDDDDGDEQDDDSEDGAEHGESIMDGSSRDAQTGQDASPECKTQ